MSNLLTIAEVERIAALARLELTDEEKQLFARQLADILTYVEQIRKVDTTDVAPTSHVLAHRSELREDIVRESLPRSSALANAPLAGEGLFKVPRVIG